MDLVGLRDQEVQVEKHHLVAQANLEDLSGLVAQVALVDLVALEDLVDLEVRHHLVGRGSLVGHRGQEDQVASVDQMDLVVLEVQMDH